MQRDWGHAFFMVEGREFLGSSFWGHEGFLGPRESWEKDSDCFMFPSVLHSKRAFLNPPNATTL